MSGGREMPMFTEISAFAGIETVSANASSTVPKSNFFIVVSTL